MNKTWSKSKVVERISVESIKYLIEMISDEFGIYESPYPPNFKCIKLILNYYKPKHLKIPSI